MFTLLLLAGITSTAAGTNLTLGSLATRTGTSGSSGSFTPAISADGRFAAFVSQARNLATNDDVSPLLQVYRRDLLSGTTVLISVSTNGKAGDDSASAPSISADGRFVAFESVAGNLVLNDTNGLSDVFVRDTLNGATLLASLTTNGMRSGNGLSRAPQLSADGRYVAFESRATNLVADPNGLDDIFVRDLVAGTTRLIYPPALNSPVFRGHSSSPFLSSDGQLVAFENTRSNFSAFLSGDVYVRRLGDPFPIFASATVTNYFQQVTLLNSTLVSIDASGRRAAFFAVPQSQVALGALFSFDLFTSNLTVVASNVLALDPPPLSLGGTWTAYVQSNALYLHDIVQGTNVQVCGPAGLTNGIIRSSPVLSANGARLVFTATATNSGVPVLLSYESVSGLFTMISARSDGTPVSIELGSLPVISEDGSRIAYVSSAADIVPFDYNQDADVFWFDAGNGQTRLVSERAPSLPHVAAHKPGSYSTPVLSANGRFLAFVSLDNELVAGDDDSWSDVFVRELQSNTLERLVPTNRAPGAAICLRPAISADGRHLAWLEQPRPTYADEQTLAQPINSIVWVDRQSGESRFVPASSSGFGLLTRNGPALSPDGQWLAFVLSGQLHLKAMNLPGTNYSLISSNYNSPVSYSGESGNPKFTGDGQWLLFSSTSGTLISNTPSVSYGIYARNLVQNKTRFVSVKPSDFAISSVSLNYQVCGDSRHVLYTLTSGSQSRAYLADLATTNAPAAVCTNCINPSSSADGRFVAFEQQQTVGGPFNAYVRDLQTGMTELVSQRADGTAATNGYTCTPVISGDGRFVAYRGGDSRLVANDTNAAVDLFVRDRLLGFNFSITRQAPDRSHYFSPGTFNFGSDGTTLLLSSLLPGLTAEDLSPSADVFLLRVGAADSDGDGLDDQWELAFFDTLARDGSADFDGDGATDKAEFLAGTDPTNAGSTLPVLAISALSSSSRTVFWNAIPGRSYRVEFKDTVAVPGWTPIGAAVTAASVTASFVDSTIGTNSHRFYRVRILP